MSFKALSIWLIASICLLTAPLLSTEAELELLQCWSGKVRFGLTLDWGNTESSDYSGGVCLSRQTKLEDCLLHEYSLSGDFRYKKSTQTIDENKGSAKAGYRSYFNDQWSLQLSQRVEYDTVKSLHVGSHTVASLGYQILDSCDCSLMADVGFGYIYRKFSDKIESSPTIDFGLDGKKQIKENLKLANTFEITLPCNAIDELSWLDALSLCYDFSCNWSLELCHKWQYLNSPSEGKERLDRKLDLCLVYQITL